jgi:hypothetical protein
MKGGTAMMSHFRITDDTGALCPACGAPSRLLHSEGGPSFYLSACGNVGHIGVGPVPGSECGAARRVRAELAMNSSCPREAILNEGKVAAVVCGDTDVTVHLTVPATEGDEGRAAAADLQRLVEDWARRRLVVS